MRVGIGYDIHQLVGGRPLILGGIEIPFEKGLLGHSDGDALLHAIADAMLGAAALGDIGSHFPSGEKKWKDCDSKIILSEVSKKILAAGYSISNIDANIIAEKPKMLPHISKMREAIANCLSLDLKNVSIKARSAEGMDAIGKGEAIAVQAVVLIDKREEKNEFGSQEI